MKKINVGIIGCGNISGIYFENLINTFKNTNVYACADNFPEKAKEASEKWGVPVMTNDEMFACEDIEIILNITNPQSHYDICKKALLSGKHVYVEKPISLTFEDGCELVELAKSKNLMIGGAPDTFLGAGIQTCRKLIDDGFIGNPIGATAFMMSGGPESWHPAPEFYYKKGAGPMFDMGPYYLTALVNLMGRIKEVSGMTTKAFTKRTITSQPLHGTVFDVEVPTHVSSLLRFESGAVATLITSFDVAACNLPCIEIYGTKGTLKVPDPNNFGDPVFLSTITGNGFKEIPLTHNYAENSRGIGLSDMAQCIIDGNMNFHANGNLCNHVLEALCAIHTSCTEGKTYKMTTKFEKSPPLSSDLVKGYLR